MGNFIKNIFQSHLENNKLNPIERLDSLFGFYIKYFKNNGYTLGCPIGNLSLELADLSSDARKHLGIAIDKLVSIIELCISDAVKYGLISRGINTHETAQFIFQGFEGAILHLKIQKSIEPLCTFRKCIYNYLGVEAPEINFELK
jgi:TetR/AcrR family transcriptional repressor of nem operon